MDPIHKLALQTLGQNKQAIIFAPSRARAAEARQLILSGEYNHQH